MSDHNSDAGSNASFNSILTRGTIRSELNDLYTYTEAEKAVIPSAFSPHFQEPNTLVHFIIGTGSSQVTFTIHREPAFHIPPFKSAFLSPMQEGLTQTYTMSDVSPRIFNLLVQFLYRGSCLIIQGKPQWRPWSRDNALAPPLAKQENQDLVDLWVLGDRLCYPEVCTYVLSVVEHVLGELRSERRLEAWSQIYEASPRDTGLRELMVKLVAENVESKALEELREELSKDLLLDVMLHGVKEREESDRRHEENIARSREGSPWRRSPVGSAESWGSAFVD